MDEKKAATQSIDVEAIQKRLLKTVADIEGKVEGAFNIRRDGGTVERFSTKNIEIRARADGLPGIDVIVAPGTKNESVHIPVILTEAGLNEKVYNDFIIGAGADVTIIAGCAIHNCGCDQSEHDGVHTFNIGKGAKVRYSEKHYGEGEGTGARVLNPTTVVHMEADSFCEMEMTQIEGVSSTIRDTVAHLGPNARLSVIEKLLTHDEQTAVSDIDIHLDGDGASARIISRSVAKDNSKQEFKPVAIGNAACRAHIQCDSIIMDASSVRSIPAIEANHPAAEIVHEAAIGRINSDQLVKLETLGLSEEEAEQVIIGAFLE
ncbi:SufD family Fe-S cluster assembly protein [Ruminococcaceae bacterium OttesenSCG-928-O06]|nr:SufD family Fe-S cluster assembly protein [Ruminococcaceae bacterium OttesenSCG-928-O06]